MTTPRPAMPPAPEADSRPTRLDYFVAYAVARADGAPAPTRGRLEALGVDLEEARKVGESAMKRLFGGPGAATPGAIIQFFGKPTVRRVERLAWDLALWPDHRFECFIGESGVDGGEVVLRERDEAIWFAEPPASPADAEALFRPWHHTRRDVARVLGDTTHDAVTYPLAQHEWRLADGSSIACTFAHGLLLDIRPAAPRAAPVEGRKWWKFW